VSPADDSRRFEPRYRAALRLQYNQFRRNTGFSV